MKTKKNAETCEEKVLYRAAHLQVKKTEEAFVKAKAKAVLEMEKTEEAWAIFCRAALAQKEAEAEYNKARTDAGKKWHKLCEKIHYKEK